MSNSNTNLQTQSSEMPHNAIMEAKTVPVAEGSSETTAERYMENYKNVSQDIRDQINAEAEAVQIILTGIDNDIYSTYEVNEIRTERLARTANPLAPWKNVGTPVRAKVWIQCYNCKEYGHVSRECQKPKRVKDAAYHKEKMLLCKQEEAGVQLNAEQADWNGGGRMITDYESDDQEWKAH
ncbi:retrovirus-related pol polyprotein from transposon TNT 1-94 [Tanacetum coccineum]